MKREDLEQIGAIVDKRVSRAENTLKKYVREEIKSNNKEIFKVVDEKVDFLAKLTNKGFDKMDRKLNRINDKVDDYDHDIAVIEKKQEAETKTLDNHEERIEILEKVH